MRADLNTACLACTSLNSAKLSGMELGIRGMSHVDIPAPIAWYDIEKDGKNNDSPDRNIVTDFSGNGRHLTLYNFAYSAQSGYHGYENWLFSKPRIEYERGRHTETAIEIGVYYYKQYDSFDAIISNMQEGDYIYYFYRYKTSGSIHSHTYIRGNGRHSFPGKKKDGDRLFYGFNLSPGVVIEVVPKYPSGLAFDGISDYAQFVGDLGLKDYTVILDREYPAGNYTLLRKIPLISSTINETNTPFIMETLKSKYNGSAYSYNRETYVGDSSGLGRFYVIQTPTKYRRIFRFSETSNVSFQIERGASIDTGKGLSLGGVSEGKDCFPLVLYKLLIFDVTLSAEQIKAARLMYGFKKT